MRKEAERLAFTQHHVCLQSQANRRLTRHLEELTSHTNISGYLMNHRTRTVENTRTSRNTRDRQTAFVFKEMRR